MPARFFALSTVLVLAACASASGPSHPSAGEVGLALPTPDLDLSGYETFILDSVQVSYLKDPRGQTQARPFGENNYALTDSQMDAMKRLYRREITRALTENDGLALEDASVPGALHVTAHLDDLVIRTPTEPGMGSSRTYVDSWGAVTLVVEFRDSETGEVLTRMSDRRDPTRNNHRLLEVDPAAVRSDVWIMFARWADEVRARIDRTRSTDGS